MQNRAKIRDKLRTLWARSHVKKEKLARSAQSSSDYDYALKLPRLGADSLKLFDHICVDPPGAEFVPQPVDAESASGSSQFELEYAQRVVDKLSALNPDMSLHDVNDLVCEKVLPFLLWESATPVFPVLNPARNRIEFYGLDEYLLFISQLARSQPKARCCLCCTTPSLDVSTQLSFERVLHDSIESRRFYNSGRHNRTPASSQTSVAPQATFLKGYTNIGLSSHEQLSPTPPHTTRPVNQFDLETLGADCSDIAVEFPVSKVTYLTTTTHDYLNRQNHQNHDDHQNQPHTPHLPPQLSSSNSQLKSQSTFTSKINFLACCNPPLESYEFSQHFS